MVIVRAARTGTVDWIIEVVARLAWAPAHVETVAVRVLWAFTVCLTCRAEFLFVCAAISHRFALVVAPT